MLRAIVVTHPEATHHVERRVGGWWDSELTTRGTAQATAIAEELAHRLGDPRDLALYTSDLRRTAQTAAVIGRRLGVVPRSVPDLREKSFGEAEGQPDSWLRERFVPPPASGERMAHDEGILGAETKGDWVTRVYGAMDRLLADRESTKVIVTHGGTATFVIAHWIGMPLRAVDRVSFPLSPGSITVLREDDYFHNREVHSLNETGHLGSD